jgi:hypothetical protein
MENRQKIKITFPEKKKKKLDCDLIRFIRKIERDEILINKCEIPKDGEMKYCRPWKI